jgi:hypothetical protein
MARRTVLTPLLDAYSFLNHYVVYFTMSATTRPIVSMFDALDAMFSSGQWIGPTDELPACLRMVSIPPYFDKYGSQCALMRTLAATDPCTLSLEVADFLAWVIVEFRREDIASVWCEKRPELSWFRHYRIARVSQPALLTVMATQVDNGRCDVAQLYPYDVLTLTYDAKLPDYEIGVALLARIPFERVLKACSWISYDMTDALIKVYGPEIMGATETLEHFAKRGEWGRVTQLAPICHQPSKRLGHLVGEAARFMTKYGPIDENIDALLALERRSLAT